MAANSNFVNDLVSGKLAGNTLAPKSAPAKAAPAPAAKGPGNNGVFWIGSNGQVYVKGAKGTNAAGAADGNTAQYWSSRGYSAINDPNAPAARTDAPGDPNNSAGSGGGGAPVYADKSNDRAIQMAGLSATDQQEAGGIAQIDKTLASIMGGYDTEAEANTKNYTDQSNNNQNQFQTGKQTSLVNAAEGRRGLLGSLASIGALSGDSLRLANNAVQHGANQDLSGASQTYATNQSGLDTSLNTFKAADKSRRNNANTQADNGKMGVHNSAATARQNFYTSLANDYEAEGNTGSAKEYTGKAAALYPSIAQTSIPASNLAPETAAYTPTTLANYLSKGNTLVKADAPATTAGGLVVPGLVASTKKQNESVGL